jgi:hypothetical protein
MFTRRIDVLPKRIAAVVQGCSSEDEFVAAVKTALKPNATIPLLWLVCTSQHLLVCNTHRTRGLSKRLPWSEINEIRRLGVIKGSISIQVIYQELDQEDDLYPLDLNVSLSDADEFIACCLTKGEQS